MERPCGRTIAELVPGTRGTASPGVPPRSSRRPPGRSRGAGEASWMTASTRPAGVPGHAARPGQGTVVRVAKPRPHRLVFHLEGGTVDAGLAATYLRYRPPSRRAPGPRGTRPPGGSRGTPGGPIKAVASRLGLSVWPDNVQLPAGRGAATYQALRLTGRTRRLDPARRTTAAVPARSNARAAPGALRACPTRAIGPDRLLLPADSA